MVVGAGYCYIFYSFVCIRTLLEDVLATLCRICNLLNALILGAVNLTWGNSTALDSADFLAVETVLFLILLDSLIDLLGTFVVVSSQES